VIVWGNYLIIEVAGYLYILYRGASGALDAQCIN